MTIDTEKMTSYQRVMKAVNGEKPDRVPVVPAVRDWCIRQAGFRFSEIMLCPERYVYSQYYCVREFQYDAVWDLLAVHAESEAMGSILKIQEDAPPSVLEPIVRDYGRDLAKLNIPNPYKDGRLPKTLQVVRRLKDLCSEEIPVLGYVQAPFRHACMLRGLDNVIKDLYKNPEPLRDLLEISVASLIPYGTAVAHSGADIICISDPTCSRDLISKRHWEEFAFPYLKRLVDHLKKTKRPIMFHVCGDTSDRLNSFVDVGIDILNLDSKVDFGFARDTVGERVCLMGNVDPTTTLYYGSPEQVREESKRVIRQAGLNGNFILSSGCFVTAGTPRENIKAMVDTAKSFGNYPIE